MEETLIQDERKVALEEVLLEQVLPALLKGRYFSFRRRGHKVEIKMRSDFFMRLRQEKSKTGTLLQRLKANQAACRLLTITHDRKGMPFRNGIKIFGRLMIENHIATVQLEGRSLGF